MTRSAFLVLAAAVPLALAVPAAATAAAPASAAPAAAGAAAFGPSQPLGMTVTGELATAIGAHGEAAVAGLDGSRPTGTYVDVASRTGAAAAWRSVAVGPVAPQARYVQVAVTSSRVVVAWAQAVGDENSVVVATGPLGAKPRIRARIAVGDADAASPRLTRMSNGDVILAWRDGSFGKPSSVRVARIDADRLATAPRTVGHAAAEVVLTARGSGAAVGWTSAYRSRPGTRSGSPRRAQPRTLTVVSLNSRGAPGATTIVGRDVGATARIFGAPDGRLVATWARPTQIRPYPGEDRGDPPPISAYVFPRAFTRQVLPRLRPARPIGAGAWEAEGPPSIAFDGPDEAIAVVRAQPTDGGPMYAALGASAHDGGPWSNVQPLAALGFTRMDPVVAAPQAGVGVIAYTALDPTINAPPRWIVAANDDTGMHRLGTTDAGDGLGASVASAPGRVLVAWNDTDDAVQVAERG